MSDRYFFNDAPLDSGNLGDVTERLITMVSNGEDGYVCVTNVHMLVLSSKDKELRTAMHKSLFNVPDGMPLVWLLKLCGATAQQRVAGPDLMMALCRLAANAGIPVGLLGGSEDTLEALRNRLSVTLPTLKIAYAHSPPYRLHTTGENREIARACEASGAKLLFVGLGCPKQEKWMHSNTENLAGVMVGVGAAFDYHAGNLRRAPRWMQAGGLEWLYRLLQEPRRLFWRYLSTNSYFLVKIMLPTLLSLKRNNQHPNY